MDTVAVVKVVRLNSAFSVAEEVLRAARGRQVGVAALQLRQLLIKMVMLFLISVSFQNVFTRIDHPLVGIVFPMPALPSWKARSMQPLLPLKFTYTDKRNHYYSYVIVVLYLILLCSMVLVPQMTGGLVPPVLVTLNLSVRHCVP
jgi:hypothetical protein